MTTAQGTIASRLKDGVIDALAGTLDIPDLAIVDAKQRDDTALPMLAIDVTSSSNYDTTLRDIQRITLTATLVVHYGDDEPNMIESWIDEIETALAQTKDMLELATNGLRIFDFVYAGSVQEWMDESHATTFTINAIATRFLTPSQI